VLSNLLIIILARKLNSVENVLKLIKTMTWFRKSVKDYPSYRQFKNSISN